MIAVLSLPPVATIQDLGRDGHWFQGLGRAGAMDPVSHRLANLMLGNDQNAATLEIPLTPARLRFDARGAFAVSGAACGATLDARPLPRIFAGVAEAGQVLAFGPMQRGARVYLAVPGGFDAPIVLGSRSTQLREAFGGFEGRVLAPGDRLTPLVAEEPALPEAGLSLDIAELRLATGIVEVRALPSTEHAEFSTDARETFWNSAYRITPQSNRQGYRLDGPRLARTEAHELRSHGIVPGIVQVPNGGQPIIQLADSATMGGYPKIAAVIEADLWRIGQAKPGDSLRFLLTDSDGAAQADRELADIFARLGAGIADLSAQVRAWR